MKEIGTSGYADFWKTPGDGGNAVFQSNKHKMKEKGAGGYAVFRKNPGAAGGYKNSQGKEWDRRKQKPEAMPIIKKPRTQPEAMQIFNP